MPQRRAAGAELAGLVIHVLVRHRHAMQRPSASLVTHRPVGRTRRRFGPLAIQPDRRIQPRIDRIQIGPAAPPAVPPTSPRRAHRIGGLHQREIGKLSSSWHGSLRLPAGPLRSSTARPRTPSCRAAPRTPGSCRSRSAAIRRAGSFGALIPCHRAIVASISARNGSMSVSPWFDDRTVWQQKGHAGNAREPANDFTNRTCRAGWTACPGAASTGW